MKTMEILKRRILASSLALGGGTLAINLIPSCETALTTVNPCGTIFAFCVQDQVDLLFADVPSAYLDPSCTVPYFGLYGDAAGGAVGGGTCSTTQIYPNTPGPRPAGQPEP